jgi:hypothetical protein
MTGWFESPALGSARVTKVQLFFLIRGIGVQFYDSIAPMTEWFESPALPRVTKVQHEKSEYLGK